jgi:hypothetical protein
MQCRMRNLPKVFTHDQLGNRTPDLSLSGQTPLPLGHELLHGASQTHLQERYKKERGREIKRIESEKRMGGRWGSENEREGREKENDRERVREGKGGVRRERGP